MLAMPSWLLLTVNMCYWIAIGQHRLNEHEKGLPMEVCPFQWQRFFRKRIVALKSFFRRLSWAANKTKTNNSQPTVVAPAYKNSHPERPEWRGRSLLRNALAGRTNPAPQG